MINNEFNEFNYEDTNAVAAVADIISEEVKLIEMELEKRLLSISNELFRSKIISSILMKRKECSVELSRAVPEADLTNLIACGFQVTEEETYCSLIYNISWEQSNDFFIRKSK